MPEEYDMPQNFAPCMAQFPGEQFVIGGGVAIFHIASSRVVICSVEDRGRKYFFLPKGRRDAGEESSKGAEREGFEESGYRNRILPLPTLHTQPQSHPRVPAIPMTAEALWLQLMPLGRRQYVVFWYCAETLPPDVEGSIPAPKPNAAYTPPPAYPANLTLRERIKLEPEGYEPVHHENTGVDEEEKTYTSHLVSIEEAIEKLEKSVVLADVVRRGWQGIQDRLAMEDAATSESPLIMTDHADSDET